MSKYTPEQDARILALHAEGLSFPAIARQLRLGHKAVYGRYSVLTGRKRMGYRSPTRERGEPWKAMEDAKLLNLRDLAKFDFPEIAVILGRSAEVVHGRYHTLKSRERKLADIPPAKPDVLRYEQEAACIRHAEAVMAQGGFAWLSEKSLGNGRYAVCLPLNYPRRPNT